MNIEPSKKKRISNLNEHRTFQKEEISNLNEHRTFQKEKKYYNTFIRLRQQRPINLKQSLQNLNHWIQDPWDTVFVILNKISTDSQACLAAPTYCLEVESSSFFMLRIWRICCGVLRLMMSAIVWHVRSTRFFIPR